MDDLNSQAQRNSPEGFNPAEGIGKSKSRKGVRPIGSSDEDISGSELSSSTQPQPKKLKIKWKSKISPYPKKDSEDANIEPKMSPDSREAQIKNVTEVLAESSTPVDEESSGQETLVFATRLDGLVVDHFVSGYWVNGESYFSTKFKNVENLMLLRMEDARTRFPQDLIKLYESKISWCYTPETCDHEHLVEFPQKRYLLKKEGCPVGNDIKQESEDEQCCEAQGTEGGSYSSSSSVVSESSSSVVSSSYSYSTDTKENQ